MKLHELYRTAVQVGIANDWRGPECIDAILEKAKQDSTEPGFDEERLWNPYGDTRISWGDRETEITSLLVGIEIHPTQVLLASQMRAMGKQVDLVLSHHMSCINRGLHYFDDILVAHKYAAAEVGVPKEKCEPMVDAWTASIQYGWKMDTINTAKNLGLPLMNIHMPCDLLHVKHNRDTFARMADATLGEIAAALNRVEEIAGTPYEEVVVHGDPSAKPGKVYNPTGAGWSAPVELLQAACDAGIDTVVFVAPSQTHLEIAETYGVNLVELPHNSNDNIGINRLLDELEKIQPLEIYEADNFRRTRSKHVGTA